MQSLKLNRPDAPHLRMWLIGYGKEEGGLPRLPCRRYARAAVEHAKGGGARRGHPLSSPESRSA